MSWKVIVILLVAAAVGGYLVIRLGGGGGGTKVPVPGQPGFEKTSATERAERRLYDGAPPVIPHAPTGAACLSCHGDRGLHVPDLGFAPPNPHGGSHVAGDVARCEQCHVFRHSDELFVESEFVGFRQDLRKGRRLNPLAPPVIPHHVKMRENCAACHDGPAAREEIRCPHPERVRCRQCHVPTETNEEFERVASRR